MVTRSDDAASRRPTAAVRGHLAAFAAELRTSPMIFVAAVAGFALGVATLPLYTLGPATAAIQAEFGWSRVEVQGFFTFLTLGVVLGSPFVGRLGRRFGMRRIAVGGTLGLGFGLIALGLFTRSLAGFYGLIFLTALTGAATTSVLWSQVMFRTFRAMPAFALAVALTCNGLIVMTLPSLATWLVETRGWRASFVGAGLLPLAIVLPLALLTLDRCDLEDSVARRDDNIGIDLATALRSRRLWTLGLGFFFVMLGSIGLSTNLLPLLVDKGLAPAAAARMVGTMVVGMIVGRLCTGALLDRAPARFVAAVVFALPIASCVLLQRPGDSDAATIVAVLFVGVAIGAELDLLPYFVRRYFGMRHFADIYGVCYALFVSASAVAPPLVAYFYDRTGSHALGLTAIAGCFICASLAMLTLGAYPDLRAHIGNQNEL